MWGTKLKEPHGGFLPIVIVGLAYIAKLAITLAKNGWHVQYWSGWWDQSQYLRSSTAFAAGNLQAGEHWYPLLYPLLEAIPAHLTPRAPFVLLNLILYLFCFAGFARVATAFGVGRAFAALLFCITTVAYPEFGNTWVEPWSTTLSACLIWLALAEAVAWLSPGRSPRTIAAAVRLGLLLAAIPLCRPADVVVSGVIFLFVAAATARRPEALRALVVVVSAAAMLVLAYGLLYLAIYGLHATAYMKISAAFGVMPGWLPWKAYLLLIEPLPWFPYGQGVLQVCPWIVPGVAGLVAGCFNKPGNRLAPAMLLTAAAGYLWLMLCYVDLLPPGLWKWGNINYFKWLLPLFGLFLVIFVRMLAARPRPAVFCLAPIMVAASVHAVPRPVAPNEPARALRIDVPPSGFEPAYAARSIIRDKAGIYLNGFEYRQVPNGSGLLAIAQKGDFQGGEIWIPQTPASVRWPEGVGPGDPVFAGGERRPSARYGVRWTIGAPCWLPPYPCGLAKRTR